MLSLSAKFLLNDRMFSKTLISKNPFINSKPPKYVKADLYLYKFANMKNSSTDWWTRRFERNYMPPVSFNQIEEYIKKLGWNYNRVY